MSPGQTRSDSGWHQVDGAGWALASLPAVLSVGSGAHLPSEFAFASPLSSPCEEGEEKEKYTLCYIILCNSHKVSYVENIKVEKVEVKIQ